MTAPWIEPAFLQLVGLGSSGDPYLPDGRHLRWFFGGLLGFPRAGFRLRRRPSPLLWNDQVLLGTGIIRSQGLTQSALGSFSKVRLTNGLTLSKVGGSWYRADGSKDPPLRIDGQPVRLDFGHEGPAPTPPPGPLAANPAAGARTTGGPDRSRAPAAAGAGRSPAELVGQYRQLVPGSEPGAGVLRGAPRRRLGGRGRAAAPDG